MNLALRRIAADIVDLFLVGSYVISICFFGFEGHLISEHNPVWAVLAICIPIVYCAYLESKYGGGSTIGKRLFGLIVVQANSEPLFLYQSTTRALVKIGLPTILASVASEILAKSISYYVVAIAMAVFITPVSIFVGKGVVSLGDAFTRTGVFRCGHVSSVPPIGYRYWTLTIVLSGILAFPGPTIIAHGNFRFLNGSLMDFAKEATGSRPLLVALMNFPQGSDLQRFIKYIAVHPAIDEFPASFGDSPSRNLEGSLHGFRNRKAFLEIDVEMTPSGYESELVRTTTVRHIGSVIPQFMPPISDPGQFVWVRLYKSETYGLVSLVRGISRIIIYPINQAKPNEINGRMIEPEKPNFWLCGIEAISHSHGPD
jgi:uncharacterized RDD family membrane protein YckC